MQKRLIVVTIFISLFGIITSDAYAAPSPDNAIATLKQSGKAFANVAKIVSPAVVSIQSEITANPNVAEQQALDELGPLQPFFEDFFKHFGHPTAPNNPNNQQKVLGEGSGFIISKDGYILTNNHVVDNAVKITVILEDDKEYQAKLIGADPLSDIAVIKIDGTNFPVLEMGNSDAIEVGEWVVAIGSPLGLSHSLSAGIVSAKGRSKVGILDYENFIQTDAAINVGNSGGPLIDLDAKVIGINTAIVSKSGGYMGIGFAIPINMARNIAEQLIKNGKVTRGYLGVRVQDLTTSLAKSFNLKDRHGVLVSVVVPNSPAAKGGIQQSDIILAIDGKLLKNASDFRNIIAFSAPGTEHKIKLLRNGKEKTITIVVGVIPDAGTTNKNMPEQKTLDKLGFSIIPLDSNIASQLGNIQASSGVVVTNVKIGSNAELAGLKRGVVIVQVNGRDVKDIPSFEAALAASDEKNIRMLIEDQHGPRFIGITLN
jgi:serine protease Do